MEEAGWRWLLQPELEKMFPFSIAALITSFVWSFWHLPLFFIKGSSQSGISFFAFMVLVIGVSFALATVYGYSKNIWLCVLMHCCLNAFPTSFEFKQDLSINTGISIVLVVSALIIRTIWVKRQNNNISN
jgi:CAAX amino terminal protease family.